VTRAWIDPEHFIVARHVAGFSRLDCGRALGVTVRTVRNWERGRARIPYSAFKLLRILSGYELPGAWSEFAIRRGVLWSPEGKPFYPWEMSWLSLVFRMARHWMAERGLPESLPASGALERLQAVQGRGAQAPAPGNPRPPTVPLLAPVVIAGVGERSLPGPLPVVIPADICVGAV
jgi:transcriptional regulator with XRE-family HTH domain